MRDPSWLVAFKTGVLLSILSMVHPLSVHGDVDPSGTPEQRALLAQLTDPDWNKRLSALESLMGDGANNGELSASLRPLLISLLASENQARDVKGSDAADAALSGSGAYHDYYSWVISSVARQHDPRSIPALAGAIDADSAASSALADFGSPAIDSIVGRLSDPQESVRQAAERSLSEMLDYHAHDGALSSADVSKIKTGLVRGVHDPDGVVRLSTIDGLTRLASSGDPDALGLLRALKNNDPYQLPSSGDHPVEDKAQDALNQFLKS